MADSRLLMMVVRIVRRLLPRLMRSTRTRPVPRKPGKAKPPPR